MNKSTMLVVGVVVCVVVLIGSMFAGVNNTVVSKEEQLKEATSTIQTAQKERLDSIKNLVKVVESAANYESETLQKVIEMRTTAEKGGNIENVNTILSAVAEAYPELKANTQFQDLGTAVQKYEARVRSVRDNYNIQVKSYNKFVGSFPNSIFLGMMGYEKLDAEYLDFGTSADAPEIDINLNNK